MGHGTCGRGRIFRDGAAPGGDPDETCSGAGAQDHFEFLELRHKIEIHNLTGRVAECLIDEINRPRDHQQAKLRIPPAAEQIVRLFGGWREEL